MKKNINPILAISLLIIMILACANPLGTPTPVTQNSIETVVAATLTAMTAPAAAAAPTSTALPASTSNLLPHPMYFLSADAAGLMQVYRLETDGKTVKQLTFEPVKVEFYDVSPVDGSVVYVSNNQLLNVLSDGSSRSMLVDGGPVDENHSYLTRISNPVFSPDGETIAFGFNGLNFYSIISGQYNNVLKNKVESFNSGELFPLETYWPEKYTADGKKLIISIGLLEGGTTAIYNPGKNELTRLTGIESATICCGNTYWTADGSAFYAAYPYLGMTISGLWRVDSASGEVTTLLKSDEGNGTFNFASTPYLASDGQLYYFFSNQTGADEFLNRPALQIVRSAPDGVTNRTVLRPETYEFMNEALWAPDASFVIVVTTALPEVYQGGSAQLVYTDGQKSVIPLLPDATKMKWGP